jgi:aryl-alcohol dehydrogenase-like predicted oxidoreductase
METFEIAPGYVITRVIKGGWQLAGGHGSIDSARAIAEMAAFYDAGITTFDCADIYTGVEEMIGAFRKAHVARHGRAALDRLRVHTKFVPDLAVLPTITRQYVADTIDRSCARLGVERLDLVQFHWWDYRAERWIDTALWLKELQQAGKIDRLSGTNFDTARLDAFADAGVRFATMQVQYSVLDARAENGLVEACRRYGTQILCFGTVAGGFLSERWLGAAEPAHPLENRSLTKYKLIIDEFGGWALFQDLLAALARVGARHGVGIGAVASRWAIDRPQVAAAIVGARNADHLAENLKVGALRLTEADRAEIGAVLAHRKGPTGDVYDLERDSGGRHATIMKYNLNADGHH